MWDPGPLSQGRLRVQRPDGFPPRDSHLRRGASSVCAVCPRGHVRGVLRSSASRLRRHASRMLLEALTCNYSKALKTLARMAIGRDTVSSHAFEVLHRTSSEVEVVHKVEGHRYKFSIVKNSKGVRSLSDTASVTANKGAAHRPELFSGTARAFATSEAHRKHAID